MLQSCSVVLEPDESAVYHMDFSALCAECGNMATL